MAQLLVLEYDIQIVYKSNLLKDITYKWLIYDPLRAISTGLFLITKNLLFALKDHKKINNEKMQQVADQVKAQLPGCGFAIIAFDLEEGATRGNYISNVQDEFMIKTLEHQVRILKERSMASSTPAVSPDKECT